MTPLKLFLAGLLLIALTYIFEKAVDSKYKTFADLFKAIGGILIIVLFLIAIWGVFYYIQI